MFIMNIVLCGIELSTVDCYYLNRIEGNKKNRSCFLFETI